VQRINDRIMTQLEEATIHAAALEAQFRVRERNWKDKLDGLEASLAKLRNEEAVERNRLKEEIDKSDVRYSPFSCLIPLAFPSYARPLFRIKSSSARKSKRLDWRGKRATTRKP